MMRVLITAFLLGASLAQAAFNYWDEPDDSAYRANIGTPPACDYVIDSVGDWAQINSGSYRVFCVAPGDYTSLGTITLTADGTALAPRWIRYYNPAVADSAHPYHFSLGDRAIIRNVSMSAANYWIMDRISIDMTGGSSATHAILVSQSSNNVFSRLDLRDFWAGITFYNGSSYNTVQDSTLHDNSAGYDAGAVQNHSWDYDGSHPLANCQYNRVISNEIWNVGDGFQNIGGLGSDPEEDYRGTVVYNNDMYVTTDRYTDCSGSADPDGLCARAENAVDLKSSSGSAAAPVIIAHNRMWGFRESQSGSGMSDQGNALVAHFLNENLQIEGNIIWDSATGLYLGYDFTASRVGGNLFHTLLAASNDGTWGTTTEGLLVSGIGNLDLDVDDNVFSGITGGSRRTISFSGTALTDTDFSYTDEVLIDSDNSYPSTGTFAGTVSGNSYYASDVPTWDASPLVNEVTVVGSDYATQFCTTIKRITAPTAQCFDNAVDVDNIPESGTAPVAPTNWRVSD